MSPLVDQVLQVSGPRHEEVHDDCDGRHVEPLGEAVIVGNVGGFQDDGSVFLEA